MNVKRVFFIIPSYLRASVVALMAIFLTANVLVTMASTTSPSASLSSAALELSPTSLSSTQAPDTSVTLFLTLSNTGPDGADWTLTEAESAQCNATDLAWASASPTNGGLEPSGSQTIDVTFDSTGLAVGSYTGSLCIEGSASVLSVPLTLNVTDEPSGGGTIEGLVFNDLNGNGQREDDEPALTDQGILLEREDGSITSAVTDDQGSYSFTNVEPGIYAVKAALPPGGVQTFPEEPYNLTVQPGQVLPGIDFGIQLLNAGTIHGMKFHDLNGDGVKDPGEPGLPNWEILLEHEDGTLFEAITDDEGNYWFMNLSGGAYTVSEVQQTGWDQTFPASGIYTLLLDFGEVAENIDFGNWPSNPAMCAGAKPTFEASDYASFTGSVSLVTGSDSPVLTIFDLQPPYLFHPTNWQPPKYSHSSWTRANLGSIFGLTLDATGNIYVTATSAYYFDSYPASGSGAVYKIDGTTSAISTFATLPNDPSQEPALGNISYDQRGDQFFVTNHEDGLIYRLDSGGGTTNTYDHGVDGRISAGLSPIADDGTPGFTQLGRRLWGVEVHGNRLYYSVWWEHSGMQNLTEANEIWSVALDITGDFVPGSAQLEISLPVYSGQNSQPVSDISFSPVGNMLIAERTMYSDAQSSAHQSRALEYAPSWTLINTYKVGELSGGNNSAGGVDYDYADDSAWATGDALHFVSSEFVYGLQGFLSPTTLAGSVIIDLNGITSGQDKTEIGDVEIPCPEPVEQGEIHGVKFLDLDGDGIQDPNEPGIPGWPIQITDNDGTVISDTTTNSQGEYWFMDLEPETYNVMEDVLPGWVQSSPPTVKHTIELTAGAVIASADFGNTAACEDPESDSCQAGLSDDFDGSDGPEPASPSPELLAFLESCSGNPQTQFDQPSIDRCFGHTFSQESGDSCLSHDCLIVGASVTIHLKATGNGSGDDLIGFMQNGVYVWATEIANLPEAGGTWNNGQEGTFTLDLANLPPDLFGVTNILATLQDGDLDVFVLEDTMVDYITLDVEYCCDCQPKGGKVHGQKFLDENGNGIKDDGEPGLSGWTIELEDADGNVISIVTNSEGNYWFMDLLPGTYTVSEVMQDGWIQTFPAAPGTYTVELDIGDELEGLDFGNMPEDGGAIHGMKFLDENGNGVKDDGEPGLEGWTIVLVDADGNEFSIETDADGNYWFMGLPSGTYTVSEVMQDGWIQTFPESGTYVVELDADEVLEGLDFGNMPDEVAIHGMKFLDENGNGVKDDGEPGLSGWTIKLVDADGNEYSIETDADGNYWFMGLPSGTYTVSEVMQDGWIQTFPAAPGTYTVELDAGDELEGLDFGNWQGVAIHGMKFLDENGNGVKDDGEPGLSGWTIKLVDADGNEYSIETDADGNYWFMDLPPGTYTVSEVMQDGWIQTFPESGTYVVELDAGDVLEGLDFGNWQGGAIHGMKFLDENGNGVKDDGEPGLEGWTIVLVDADGNEYSIETDADGNYWFMDLPPGTYTVSEVMQDGWIQTFPESGTYVVELDAGDVLEGLDFGNWQAGEIHGMKFLDENGNGVKDDGEPGLPGWTIVLLDADGNEYSIETDADGNYWFMDLPPGTYTIKEVMQDGWTQTLPESGSYIVELSAGEVLEGFDFGNTPDEGEIHGMKFYDENGNGIKDPGERGIPGWTILLQDADGNVISMETDEEGNYWFMDLPPGTYTLAELFEEPGWEWQQTTPLGTHVIEVGPGEVIENIDFGNWQEGKDDYCSIRWDYHFFSEEPMEIEVKIKNTSNTPEKAYEVQMIGLPAGTLGSNADGPTTFDILTPLPISVNPGQIGSVGVDVHYPASFANGDPGPALYQAIVTNLTTGTTFGCKAALWPVKDIQPVPADTDIVQMAVGQPRPLAFTIRNVGQINRRIAWRISAMTQGINGNSPIVRLSRSQTRAAISGEAIEGELTLEAGESSPLTVTVEFLEHAPLGVTDILLELDIDEDGITDVVVSSVISSVDGPIENTLFLPFINR